MLINNIDLSSLGVKLYNRVISSNQVDTTEDWLEGDIQPTFIRQQDKFKNIMLQFLVLSNSEEQSFVKISKLTQALRKASIKFDDLDYIFDVTLQGKAKTDRLKNGNFIVTYNFSSDYAKGEREVYTTNANLTNAFKLTVLYYQNGTNLIANETVTLRASEFKDENTTFDSIGIKLDLYKPNYYNSGIVTNLGTKELTYDNLLQLGTLIINYSPIVYNLKVNYLLENNEGVYNDLMEKTVGFTYPQLQTITSIGQLIDIKSYKPEGYKGRVSYDGELTVENLLAAAPIYVFYDKVKNDLTKTITVVYKAETDNGYIVINSSVVVVKDSEVFEGTTLGDIVNVDAFKPQNYYNSGFITDNSTSQLVTFKDLKESYEVCYAKTTNTIFVEYYVGVYPGWYRLTTNTLVTVHKDSYDTNFSLSDIGLDLNKHHTSVYYDGQLYNGDNFTSYESVISAGVLQVYYRPIDYNISVVYSTDDETMTPITETVKINALNFMGEVALADIIDINKHRPEGYQFNVNLSYDGEISLSALTQASPISIVYEEIQEVKTKNIILKYKQEMASAFATINTSIITISEADCQGGVRLENIFNMNLYRPDYYEPGVIDGSSSTVLLNFEQIQSTYSIMYMASSFVTPVRYYTDEVSEEKWIGSSSITYKIIDFTTETTLYDLDFSINLYKPNNCDDGVVQYKGPINFEALRNLESIDVVYKTIKEPEDDSGIDYPHRFLFLEHNDLGNYENLHPNWTMNHAYINTGVSCLDMSKLTVIMETARVDENVPLHNVISGYGYLFGSSSPSGNFFMRFNNQTQYGTNLTGVNTYEAQAGKNTDIFVQAETTARGFSENTGIYSIERKGYSNCVFTYTNLMQTENAQMPYPLYLFANNNAGRYANGIAGVGIYGCRIYYSGKLIRDLIPVQFYDKIGDQVAPSNCLYDKVTKTFFEDGTGQNSFNIKDDERYEDTNLEHKIGTCFVNYYKGEQLIHTIAYYFRASDFVDTVIDPYTKFEVDKYQPPYYKSGEIKNFKDLIWDFDNMNGSVYDVVYPSQENTIVVNYYKENDLIKSETIGISEENFLQAPTFGDIVRINKYKPSGYETDFQYTGAKVSLSRVIEASPYNIVYRPVDHELQTYTTTVKYIKKIYGIREYLTVGTQVLTFDDTMFRDGEYIDFYINKNEFKPAKYYKDGQTYKWYEMDERIPTPESLKPEYVIWYDTAEIYKNVNYYVDSVEEDKLIASTTWGFKYDDFEHSHSIYLVDTLPNAYINKFKPANCLGGVLQNSNVNYSFDELAALEEIAIVYPKKQEPHNPEDSSYEQKILFWEAPNTSITSKDYNDCINDPSTFAGARIPWIDLGFKPKDISRLRVEIKGYARPWGIHSRTTSYAFTDYGYSYFFGYYAPKPWTLLGTESCSPNNLIPNSPSANGTGRGTDISAYSSGMFGFRSRVPEATGWVYTSEGPQFIDGQVYYTANSAPGVIAGSVDLKYTGMYAYYRKGKYSDFDDNFNVIPSFSNYGYYSEYEEFIAERAPYVAMGRDNKSLETTMSSLGDPYTMILDVYNKYGEIYRDSDSNTPIIYKFDETGDNAFFENLTQPKGSLSLFASTNPDTGKVNLLPSPIFTFPYMGISGSLDLSGTAVGNPYDSNFKASITQTVLVQTGVGANNEPIYENKTTTKNINYASFKLPVYSSLTGCAIWSIKIYDRDRLVRDLIPVKKGDKIYDYVAPYTGLFDKETEIFFGNSNQGGTYEMKGYLSNTTSATIEVVTVNPEDVLPLQCILDPTIYGKSITNYYDYDNTFLGNQYVDIPTWFNHSNTTIENILRFNDYKPDDFHLDGMLDLDKDLSFENMTLREIYEMGAANVYYKLRQFTKTVVFYQDNVRIGSKDLFYSLEEIENAKTIKDLGINVDLYYNENFKHGKVVFDESIIASDDIKAFIDAPSPIVVYEKLSKEEAPNLLYVEYYRGGAYDDTLITIDSESPNYLNCNLEARVLNPNGAIKYYNHYHTALYEDEKFDYFIPYQVRVINKYTGIHRGPAKKYQTLAMIVEKDKYTIIEERNGWGRLKEYPIGWILLNQTEPIIGPGQNPDFDKPGEGVATIPFGDTISINKLTIDRLWAYCPEYESWIKTEDLSYTQAGKLYNGLKIEVIDLDTIDWENCDSLEKVGIHPQKWKLKFHNQSNFTYTGEFTKAAFSNLHSIDIVYEETIYHYSCIYYKYNLSSKDNLLGRSAFSCCLSDWHPDWDTFISTSWRQEEKINYGYFTGGTGDPGQYCIAYAMKDDGTIDKNNYFEIDGNTNMRIIGEQTTDGWPVQSITTGKKYYVPSKAHFFNLWKPYGGKTMVDVNPTLYRDTELTLTWDYFGFDKNRYKPKGFGDGIYLWNPRTWDKNNVKFTFNELIKCGTQYVIYPPFNPDTYKILSRPEYLGASTNVYHGQLLGTITYYARNRGISVDLSNADEKYMCLGEWADNKFYDVYTSGEITPQMEVLAHKPSSTPGALQEMYKYCTHLWYSQFYWENYKSGYFKSKSIKPYLEELGASLSKQEPLGNPEPGDYFIWNVSSHRQSPSAVFGFGNKYLNKPERYYAVKGQNSFDRIYDNTNLNNYEIPYDRVGPHQTRFGNIIPEEYHLNKCDLYDHSSNRDFYNYYLGVIYDLISYRNFKIIHYWTPVPKGLWYNYAGEQKRVPDNGMLDLMTGEFETGYRRKGRPAGKEYAIYYSEASSTDNGHENYVTPTKDAQELIFLRNDRIEADNAYDYFKDWHYNSTNCDYYVEATEDIRGYAAPDDYSNKIRIINAGTKLPISKYTSDSDNNVVGEWYKTADMWIPSSKTKIVTFPAGYTLKLEKQTICLVVSSNAQYFYNGLDPAAVNPWGTVDKNGKGQIPAIPKGKVTTCYATVSNGTNTCYFDGYVWIPLEYTERHTAEDNTNYVVVEDIIKYKYPIEDLNYKVGNYSYGDRITSVKYCKHNNEWLYVGDGWIKKTTNNLSIVE